MEKALLFQLLIIAVSMFFSGCEKKSDQIFDTEVELPMKNISYGTHSRHIMDISLPATANKDNKTFIVFCIHGGGWTSGEKEDFDWIKQPVNQYNLAYVTINYRLIQDGATYIQILDDIDAAISFLKNKGDAYHLKTDKMCIIGSSAGGHLGLLYAYSRNSPIKIACLSSMAGPTDFMDPGQIALNGKNMLGLMNELLDTHITVAEIETIGFVFPFSWKDASPVYHVDIETPPTILAHGVHDDIVSYSNAIRLHEALQKYDVDHHLISFPNSGHSLDKDPGKSQEYWLALKSFVDDYLLE